MLVGKLRPQSKIFSEVFSDPARDISYIYKLAQLYDVREVRYIDYPLLMGVQPQHATITGWPSAEKVLEAALGGHSLPFFASSLHPAQLEVVCYEYLRENLLLDRLLMPIGRCMVDLDVLGFDGAGNRVLAQVTYETNAAKLKAKGEQLLNHATAGDRCYFFAPRKALPTFGPRVSVIAIEDALETLRASPSPSAKKMLERMFRGGLGQTLGIDKVRHDPRFSRRP